MAVQELFPGTQVTIGPAIEDGFYYDFARDVPFTPDDLPKIEAKMREIVAKDLPTKRAVWPRDEAIKHFEEIGENYKAELIRSLPANEEISIYYHGDWHDLCRGPHFASTGKIGQGFRLTKIAGAYWRGDPKNRAAPAHLRHGLARREGARGLSQAPRRGGEARPSQDSGARWTSSTCRKKPWVRCSGTRRATRSIARWRTMCGAGWEQPGYQEVKTPLLIDRKLWEMSGHWENYREHMFVAEVEDENLTLAVKPMNCPGHVQIFKQGTKSYRELPLRLAEFGSCHRYEPSGALHGIMRVRAFTQDDAHIFCTHEQITAETAAFCRLLLSMYRDLGFEDVRVKLATRPTNRIGGDNIWDQRRNRAQGCDRTGRRRICAQSRRRRVLRTRSSNSSCATPSAATGSAARLQVDFNTADRLGASYIAEDGAKHVPVMLHRAVLGSMERFIGVLIEHYAGKFPLWLAPVQAVVATIVSDADSYAQEAAAALRAAGLRVETDLRNEKINYKVREHSLAKVPYLLVAGRREAENRTLTLRRLGSDAQENLALTAAIHMLEQEAVAPDLR